MTVIQYPFATPSQQHSRFLVIVASLVVLVLFGLFGAYVILPWLYTTVSQYLIALYQGAALDGAEAITYRITRNILEVGNFLGTIAIPIIAVSAGIIAYRHFNEAKNDRLASIYVELNKQYCSDKILGARIKLLQLETDYKFQKDPNGDVSIEVYCGRILIDEHVRGQRNYLEMMEIISFLECIAVMVRNGLIDKSLIFNFMGGVILRANRCLKEYINWKRQQDGDTRLYANTIWLMTEAGDFQDYFKYDEGDYSLKAPIRSLDNQPQFPRSDLVAKDRSSHFASRRQEITIATDERAKLKLLLKQALLLCRCVRGSSSRI